MIAICIWLNQYFFSRNAYIRISCCELQLFTFVNYILSRFCCSSNEKCHKYSPFFAYKGILGLYLTFRYLNLSNLAGIDKCIAKQKAPKWKSSKISTWKNVERSISLSSWNQKVKSYLEQYALSKNKSMQLHLLQKQYWNVLQVTGHIA